MNILFLGTGAAEGFPNPFCECPTCKAARSEKGASLRGNSSLLINDDLLIDVGPSVLANAIRFGISLAAVHTVLLTHPHADHLYAPSFRARRYVANTRLPLLHLYGSTSTIQTLASELRRLQHRRMSVQRIAHLYRLRLHIVRPFQSWRRRQYRITTFLANHQNDRFVPLLFAIAEPRKHLLYACDTMLFPEATWEALRRHRFDAIILDESFGFQDQQVNVDHLNMENFLAHHQRLVTEGILKPRGVFFANHLAHFGNPAHRELERYLGRYNIRVAYDGLRVRL
jgi:phosphoribosyl 1,2-cyclic phosphate phosphodiesterase